MQSASLLVIDDDQGLLYSIKKSLGTKDLRIISANSAASGFDSFMRETPTAVLLDLRLNEASGLDVMKKIREHDKTIPIIMFTAFSTTTATIEATAHGAFEYLLKPVDFQKLQETVQRAIAARISQKTNNSDETEASFVQGAEINMIGSSPAMQEVYKQIGRFAPSNSSILIVGESGTGKELVARAIHRFSKRKAEPFVAINCAALSETLLESELFGHEKGAFTGADKRRVGKFEFASGGTIFLDEVADMSPTTQAKILRLLQEQKFERLGGNDSITTNVRIVAATNKNIEALVRDAKFREDLYYRLNVFSIKLPPLRERLDDLNELVMHFVGCFKSEFGKGRIHIEQEVFSILKLHSWPGNMRELQSVIKHALAHAMGSVIGTEHLPQNLLALCSRSGASTTNMPLLPSSQNIERLTRLLLLNGDQDIYEKTVGVLETIVLPLVLDHTKGNLQQACELLGMSRNTLKAKMRQHRIHVGHLVLSKIDSPGL